MSQMTSVPGQSGQQYIFPNGIPHTILLQSYTKELRSETTDAKKVGDGGNPAEKEVRLSAFLA
jgi:hypothetical protein